MSRSYEELIEIVRSASDTERKELLDALIVQFAGAAHHWALLVLEDEDAALDAVQDAWLSAYLHLDQLREPAAFPAWFRQIVIASSHHARRGEKPALPLDEDAVEPIASSDPTEAIEQRQRWEQVREAVEALPEHERIVTELYYFAETSQQEIAETLAIPLTTVKKRLQYARQRLKGTIQPDILASLYGLDGNLPDEAVFEWSAFASAAFGMLEQPDDVYPFPFSVPASKFVAGQK